MTPERAFRKGFAAACIITVILWGVLFFGVRGYVPFSQWVFWLLFFLLPVFLLLSVYGYGRYRYALKPKTRRYHIANAALLTAVSVLFAIDALGHGLNVYSAISLVLAIMGLAFAANQVRLAMRADKTASSSKFSPDAGHPLRTDH